MLDGAIFIKVHTIPCKDSNLRDIEMLVSRLEELAIFAEHTTALSSSSKYICKQLFTL